MSSKFHKPHKQFLLEKLAVLKDFAVKQKSYYDTSKRYFFRSNTFIHKFAQEFPPIVTVGKHLTRTSRYNNHEDKQRKDLIVIHF